MKQSRLFHLLLLVALLSTSIFVMAQTDTARVIGTVTDPSGAVIPGASITITSLATANTKTIKADADGSFSMSALQPGKYHLEAKQTGFNTATADIVLEVSQVQQVPFRLKTGSTETVVNVTDEVPLVETSTSSTGEVIQGRQVTELPLNGRNFTQLALLTPGVTRGAYGDVSMGGTSGTAAEAFRNSETGGASISANGLRQQANNFQLDGVDNNEALVNSIVFFPPAEAIQEFRVNTSVAPAEFGRAGGAIIQTSIKSGTNSYHGSIFDFRRSGAQDAHTFGSTGPIHFLRNQFGGTVGGAIWKDKIFGFGDYQGLRQSQPQNVEFATVPTALMRTGNFSELFGSGLTTTPACYAGAAINGAIFNPATCAPYAGNIITNANAAGLKYLQAFPLPNLPGILQNFKAQRQSIRNFNDFDARLDFVLGHKDTIFARYSYGQDGFTVTDRLKDATHDLPSGFGSGDNFNHPRGIAIGETHSFSGNIVNEFRFGYTRPSYGYNPPAEGTPLAQQLGIVNANRNSLLGGIALIGGNNNEIEYTGDFGPYVVPQHTYQFLDTLSHSFGHHSFKYGANIAKRQVDFFQGNAAKGYFILGGVNYPGTGRFTGYEMSELLSGFPDYRIGPGAQYYKTRNWETGYFAQDDWRVTNRLTLNVGLRYDLYTWPYEEHNQQANFDPTTGKLILAGTNGWGKSLIDTDKNNIAPRIGFAYDLHGAGKTVIRGGYGMFFFLDRGGVGNQLSNNPGFNGTTDYQACPNGNGPVGGPMCPGGFRITFSGQGPLGNNDPTQATNALPLPAVQFSATPSNGTIIYYPRNNPNSQVQQWNVQVEHQLGANMALDVAYVGTKMSNLATSYNVNNVPVGSTTGTVAFPQYGTINAFANIGSGNYNGLQTRLNRRFSKGLQFTASYTWSHTLDNSNGGFSNNNNTIFVDAAGKPLLNYNYGNSDSDIRHFLTMSVLYELPFGRGHQYASNIPKALDYIIGGWQWNNIVTASSGTPITLNINGTPNNRPDLVSGDPKLGRDGNNWFVEGATFAAPPKAGVACNQATGAGCFYTRPGTFGRNGLEGPLYRTWDMSMFKNFNITERFVGQFRAEGFNIFNTPQFQNPGASGNNGGVNNGVSTRFSSERQLQFALRFTF
jgi:Carboxypeptidase regulatory-like domain/TonB dependent receptor